jgi:hypothetical protein
MKMNDQPIATIEKNAIEQLRVELSEYQGHNLISLRIWANYDSSTDDKHPTKKGLALRVEKLPELIEALQKAEVEAKAAGLLKDKQQAA